MNCGCRVSLSDVDWNESTANIIGPKSASRVYAGVVRRRQIQGEEFPEMPVAVKVWRRITCEEVKNMVVQEVMVLSRLRHPTIVEFVASSGDGTVVTKRCFTDVHEAILSSFRGIPVSYESPKGDRIEWNNSKRVICAIGTAIGLAFLHQNSIVHRNIQPSNVLLDNYLHPKIADFALSLTIPDEGDFEMETCVGTFPYMAPEMWDEDAITDCANAKAVDVFSYAAFLYELLTERQPWGATDIFHVVDLVSRGERPAIPDHVNERWSDVIEVCWNQNPAARPTMKEVVVNFRDNLEYYLLDDCDFNEIRDYMDSALIGLILK